MLSRECYNVMGVPLPPDIRCGEDAPWGDLTTEKLIIQGVTPWAFMDQRHQRDVMIPYHERNACPEEDRRLSDLTRMETIFLRSAVTCI